MTKEEAKATLYEWQEMMVRNGVPIDASKVQALRVAIEALNAEPTKAVPPSLADVYKWERDIALSQLEEYGIGFGEKKRDDLVEVVRCKDCRWWNEDDFPRAFPEKKTSACECPNIYGANFSRYTQEDEFCSRGVRKGGDDE
jgi:hypothetical protein